MGEVVNFMRCESRKDVERLSGYILRQLYRIEDIIDDATARMEASRQAEQQAHRPKLKVVSRSK